MRAPQVVPDADLRSLDQLLREGNLDLLLDVELGVTLRFGSRRAPLREVLELSPGAVLELNREIQEPVDLLLNDRVIARGRCGGGGRQLRAAYLGGHLSRAAIARLVNAGSDLQERILCFRLLRVFPIRCLPIWPFSPCRGVPIPVACGLPHCGNAGGRGMKASAAKDELVLLPRLLYRPAGAASGQPQPWNDARLRSPPALSPGADSAGAGSDLAAGIAGGVAPPAAGG